MPNVYELNEIGIESGKLPEKLKFFGTYSLLILWFLILFIPLVWMILCAFTPEYNFRPVPPQINLRNLTFDNFESMYHRTNGLFFVWLGNTFYVAIMVTVIGTLLSALAGYCFAKLYFPGRDILFLVLLATMMVPYQAIILPLFIIVNNMLHLADTYWAIILPQLALPFGIFLCRQHIKTLPTDLLDSGRMDGCSEFGIFLRIVLPLCKPILVVLAIHTFVLNWTNFFWPLIILRSESKFVLDVGLAYFQDRSVMLPGNLMAIATAGAIPMVVFFLIFQNYFRRGLVIRRLRH